MVFRLAAGRATEVFQRRLAEVMVWFTSEKCKALTKILDASVQEQKKAMDDIGAWLKESETKLPKGVGFKVKPGQIQMTIDISFEELGGRSRQR